MRCPKGTIEVSFWFPKTSDGGIYFDTVRDSTSYSQCRGYLEPNPHEPKTTKIFYALIERVRPVLDLIAPKNKMDTDYYTLEPDEFEALTVGIDYEMPERDS